MIVQNKTNMSRNEKLALKEDLMWKPISNVKPAIKEDVMSNSSPPTPAIKEDEKLKSKSLEVRPDTNMGKYKSEVIKGVTEWLEDDSAAKGQEGDGVNQNERGPKTEGKIWETMEIGETGGNTPTRGGKGGNPLEAEGGGREED